MPLHPQPLSQAFTLLLVTRRMHHWTPGSVHFKMLICLCFFCASFFFLKMCVFFKISMLFLGSPFCSLSGLHVLFLFLELPRNFFFFFESFHKLAMCPVLLQASVKTMHFSFLPPYWPFYMLGIKTRHTMEKIYNIWVIFQMYLKDFCEAMKEKKI